MDDARIVDMYLERDENAIAQSAAKYGARLRSLAYGILKDIQSAEECESDTYMKAWNVIPPHEPRDYLYAFLARIARRVALNRCRDDGRIKRSAHLIELSSELEQCLPAQDGYDDGLTDAINAFLASLDVEKRSIFVRRYWYLDSISDLAKRFCVSESRIKVTLFRLRAKLKEHLEKEGCGL